MENPFPSFIQILALLEFEFTNLNCIYFFIVFNTFIFEYGICLSADENFLIDSCVRVFVSSLHKFAPTSPTAVSRENYNLEIIINNI